MKALKIIIIVVLSLPLLFFGLAFFLPQESEVSRAIVIEAPAGKVFYAVSDLRQFDKWDPWSELDPNAVISYNDVEYGAGASRSWKGNDQVGEGTMTILAMEPNERVDVALDFGDMGQGTSQYLIEDLGDNSKITWLFKTRHNNLAQRYFGLILDSILGADYEKGLASLKQYVEAMPDIASREIRYEVDGKRFLGYLTHPIGALDPVPGVLVVHEWWGHNEHARNQADKLAREGFAALAVDMYGDGETAEHPEDAMAFMQKVGADTQKTTARFGAAYDILQKSPFTDPTRIAAIGYCFGGSVVINMARSGKNLKGVVSFHGGLGNLMPIADNAFTPVLAFNGGADPFVTDEQISKFKTSMDAADLDYEFVEYPGVLHSFTNKKADEYAKQFNMPVKYDAEASEKSWQQAMAFLNSVFY